jgi:hypothetical protein
VPLSRTAMLSPPRRLLASAASTAALALSSSACLVTSPPEYELPPQTAPFLVASAAFPSLWKPIAIDESTQFVTFGGDVISEDNGEDVHIALYIDYGTRNAAGLPYRNRVFPFPPIKAGRITDGQRPFEVQWFLDSVPVLKGCHTVTMVASHEFDASNVCPVELDDMSLIEWQLVNCDSDDQTCSKQCPEPTCTDATCPSCANLTADATD